MDDESHVWPRECPLFSFLCSSWSIFFPVLYLSSLTVAFFLEIRYWLGTLVWYLLRTRICRGLSFLFYLWRTFQDLCQRVPKRFLIYLPSFTIVPSLGSQQVTSGPMVTGYHRQDQSDVPLLYDIDNRHICFDPTIVSGMSSISIAIISSSVMFACLSVANPCASGDYRSSISGHCGGAPSKLYKKRHVNQWKRWSNWHDIDELTLSLGHS